MSTESIEQDWAIALDGHVHAVVLEHDLRSEGNDAIHLKLDGQPVSRRHLRRRRVWPNDIYDWHFRLGRHAAFVRIDGSRGPYRYDLVVDGRSTSDGASLSLIPGSWMTVRTWVWLVPAVVIGGGLLMLLLSLMN